MSKANFLLFFVSHFFPPLETSRISFIHQKNVLIYYTNTLGLFTSDKAKIVYIRKRKTLLNYVSFYGL